MREVKQVKGLPLTLFKLGLKLSGFRRYVQMTYLYEQTLRRKFKKYVGYEPNLEKPRSYNEKLLWLKMHYRDPLIVQCADKVAVRQYVEDRIGKDYLTPVYGIFESVDELKPSELPGEFILKTNHASGQVIICKDKSKLNWLRTKLKLQHWLLTNYYYTGGEWQYKGIKPRIICEKLHPGDIVDYKFSCFNGKPEYMFTCTDRKQGLKVTFFDLEFKRMPFAKNAPTSDNVEKPQNFELMCELAGILAKGFPFVRVDFYNIDGAVYFGEMTFFPGGGFNPFYPAEWDWKVGELIDLTKLKREYVR